MGDEDEYPPSWEEYAREAIARAVEGIELDEVRGVLYSNSGENHRFETVREEFDDADSFSRRLLEIGETEWINYSPFDGGSPLFEPNVDGMVESVIVDNKIEEFFDKVSAPPDTEELVETRDLTHYKAGLIVQVDLAEINDELIRYLAVHPELLQSIDRRKFEILVAELFKDKGYEVELTPQTRDGGKDILAFQKTDIGTLLTYIECKRPDPGNKVSVDVVRGLYGVLEAERATRGVIATTSTFTKNAKSFQKTIEYRMQLADADILEKWIREHRANH